jgi:hypothetical protein
MILGGVLCNIISGCVVHNHVQCIHQRVREGRAMGVAGVQWVCSGCAVGVKGVKLLHRLNYYVRKTVASILAYEHGSLRIVANGSVATRIAGDFAFISGTW